MLEQDVVAGLIEILLQADGVFVECCKCKVMCF